MSNPHRVIAARAMSNLRTIAARAMSNAASLAVAAARRNPVTTLAIVIMLIWPITALIAGSAFALFKANQMVDRGLGGDQS